MTNMGASLPHGMAGEVPVIVLNPRHRTHPPAKETHRRRAFPRRRQLGGDLSAKLSARDSQASQSVRSSEKLKQRRPVTVLYMR
jgi:hypothetical protein